MKEGLERNRRFEERHYARGVQAGAAVATAVEAGKWEEADIDRRLDLLRGAFDLMWPHVEVARPAQLVVSLGPDPADRGSAGFDEHARIVLFPVDWLRSAKWEEAVGALGHEMRHAWQFDLIDAEVGDDLSDLVVPAWRADASRYDHNNPAMYGSSLLEQDAGDFQRAVIEGLERSAGR